MMQLDVLRAVAILMVLGYHAVVPRNQAGLFRLPAVVVGRMGWTGVDLFFVLSGFLIGGLLMREIRLRGTLDVRRFLVRRAFKIWPSYYLYLAVLVVLIARQSGYRFGHALWLMAPNLIHLQNYSFVDRGHIAIHTWSLAVEEHFYLLLPFLLLFLARSGAKALKLIPWIALGLGLTCLALRLSLYRHPYQPDIQEYPTHIRMDSLFMGVLLAYWYHFRPDLFGAIARHRALLSVAGLLLISPMVVLMHYERFVWTIGYTLLYLGYACLLVLFVSTAPGEGALGRWLASGSARGLALIGTFSYSIYIWHLDFVMHPIQRACDAGLLSGLPSTVRWSSITLAYYALAILLGVVMAKLVENPSLALRNRLFPARADALGSVIVARDRQLSNVAETPIASAAPVEP